MKAAPGAVEQEAARPQRPSKVRVAPEEKKVTLHGEEISLTKNECGKCGPGKFRPIPGGEKVNRVNPRYRQQARSNQEEEETFR